VHLLLIAPTKMGKSTYAAQAVLDGFNVIYVDADNGLSALRHHLRNDRAAWERVNYFSPRAPLAFVHRLLKSNDSNPLVWSPTEDKPYVVSLQNPLPDDTPLWVMSAKSIPPSYVLVIDSWSSLAADALNLLHAGQSSTLLSGESDQSLYGEASAMLGYIANVLQGIQCHVIVQAHPTMYEVYEKPPGVQNPKQKDMILKEVIKVPVSSSRGHGLDLGRRFNHIGHLEVNNLSQVIVDFTREKNRVGGGPPNRKDTADKLSFRALVEAGFGSLPSTQPVESGWYRETTVGEWNQALADRRKQQAATASTLPGKK